MSRFARTSCPVTCNMPTRMSERAFRRRCAEHQVEEEHCATVCRGRNLPPGLEFIDLTSITNEERSMAGKTAQCFVCKSVKTTKSVHEKSCCSCCEHVWRMAKNYPDKLVAALLEATGREYIVNALGLEAELAEPQDGMATELAEARRVNADQAGQLAAALNTNAGIVETISKLREELALVQAEPLKTLKKAVAAELGYGDVDFDIATEVNILMQQVQVLKEQIAEATSELDEAAGQGPTSREAALLDIAIEALEGKVFGIDAARLRALR